jgi:hypothetical protein
MPTAPSLWSSGVEWATVETEGAEAEWLGTLPSSGRPHPFVSIAGRLVNGFGDDSVALQQGSWNMGRRDWFDVLTPGTASFTFFGVVDAEAGDEVVVSCEAGVLWVGNVNDRTETQTVEGHFRTTLTATDAVGRLSTAVVPDGKLTVGSDVYIILFLTLDAASAATDDVIRWLLDTYGAADVALTIGDSAGTLPNLEDWYEPPDGLTLLDILNQIERTANAMLSLQPNGSLLLTMRDALVASEADIIDLVDDDAPYEWTKTTSAADIINHWVLERAQYHDDDPVLDEADADSVALYSDRSYSVDNYLCTTATHFTAGLKAAMKVPRAIVTDGRFHIHDLGQRVLFLAPLTWVAQGDDTWQIMSVQHDFSGSSWDVTVTADVSQNAMTGEVEPDPEDPGVTVDTQTLTSSKSATVAKTSGGTNAGNGAGNNLPVGYYAGFRTRALIGFSFSWPANFIRVKSAKLNLRTTDQNWVAFGSSPRFYVRRITETWSEGTFDAAAPNQYSSINAAVWPGPAKTTSGQVLKSIGTAENNDITVDITDIAQGWHDAGGSNFSVMLLSANEDASRNTTEFWSDDHGTAGFRPELVLKCEVEA